MTPDPHVAPVAHDVAQLRAPTERHRGKHRADSPRKRKNVANAKPLDIAADAISSNVTFVLRDYLLKVCTGRLYLPLIEWFGFDASRRVEVASFYADRVGIHVVIPERLVIPERQPYPSGIFTLVPERWCDFWTMGDAVLSNLDALRALQRLASAFVKKTRKVGQRGPGHAQTVDDFFMSAAIVENMETGAGITYGALETSLKKYRELAERVLPSDDDPASLRKYMYRQIKESKSVCLSFVPGFCPPRY